MNTEIESVESLRKNSRTVVRELGLLGDEYNTSGITLVERHLMIELESHLFPDVGGVAHMLLLDKSTASRLVNNLVKKELIEYVLDEGDKRRRFLQLTDKGKNKLASIKKTAQEQVQEALTALSKEEIETVLRGMEYYAKGLKKARLRKEFQLQPISAQDNVSLAKLIVSILEDYGCNKPGFASADAELNSMSESYNQAGRVYFVVKKGSLVTGGAGIAPLEGAGRKYCELRKMYLAADARGLGLGDLLIEKCLTEAKKMGYSFCYLETSENMSQAHKLYIKHGFKPLAERKGQTGHFGCTCFFEKKL